MPDDDVKQPAVEEEAPKHDDDKDKDGKGDGKDWTGVPPPEGGGPPPGH